jgi:hypothetical protein
LDISLHKYSLESMFKHISLGHRARNSDSTGLVWSPRICVSNKLLGAADAIAHRAYFEQH